MDNDRLGTLMGTVAMVTGDVVGTPVKQVLCFPRDSAIALSESFKRGAFSKMGDVLGLANNMEFGRRDAQTTNPLRTNFFLHAEDQHTLCELAKAPGTNIKFVYFELCVGDVYIIPPG